MALESICGKFDELVSGRQTKLQDSAQCVERFYVCLRSPASSQRV